MINLSRLSFGGLTGKAGGVMRAIVVALLLSFFFSPTLVGKEEKKNSKTVYNDVGNIYLTWKQLSLIGKSQSEIEYYFRNIDQVSLNKVKQRLRVSVMENLKNMRLKYQIDKVVDQDDLNVIRDKILIEIRFAGLEYDENLRYSIQEEFGLYVNWL